MTYGGRGALAVTAALLVGGGAGAQRGGGDSAHERDGARDRAVMLRLRPHAGDTVRTRFEQTVQLFAQGAGGGAGLAATGMAGTMVVLAHSVVERVDEAGAVVASVTDSVVLRASGTAPEATEAARRAMQGRRARLRVAADGATAILGGAGRPEAAMKFPAALPPGAVTPGAMWARAMTVPWGAGRGGPPNGTPGGAPGAPGPTIDVWFRFDSLARGGTLAFLSLRGTVHGAGRRRPEAGAGEASSVNGAIVVDLARGWVVDSRTTFQLDGAITRPGAAPRPARVVVTQRLRVL